MRLCMICFTLIVFLFGLTSADFFDYLWPAQIDNNTNRGREDSNDTKSCECVESVCKCCVDLELAYVDLGGPGCVEMKYLSRDEGLLVNVSYGNSHLHSDKIKGPNPEAICTPNKVAQVCAKFSKFEPHENGEIGCLVLEPKLFGAVTAHLKMDCFSMGPDGMKIESGNITGLHNDSLIFVQEEVDGQNQTNSDTLSVDLLAVVNETAQQGLAFIGNLLGLAFGQNSNDSEIADGSNVTSVDEV